MKINIKGVIVSAEDSWIYDLFDIENVNPKMVADKIEEADGEDLDIYINSGGGDVFSADEIYSAIREYPGAVHIHVIGLAASAASVIACAGDSDISPAAQMMVHNVSTSISGNYHDMDKASEDLKKADRAIAQAYRDKTGMSEEDALELMDSETWITADDAVTYGLIDRLAENQNSNKSGEKQPERMAASVCEMLPLSVINKMTASKNKLIEYFEGD